MPDAHDHDDHDDHDDHTGHDDASHDHDRARRYGP